MSPKYSVEIINFDYLAATGEFFYRDTINQNVEPMASIILKNRPKIVGFYTICHSFLPTLMLAKKISELDPKVKIIFGGPHASLTADYCLNTFKFIDAICIGESELIIMPLMDALINSNFAHRF